MAVLDDLNDKYKRKETGFDINKEYPETAAPMVTSIDSNEEYATEIPTGSKDKNGVPIYALGVTKTQQPKSATDGLVAGTDVGNYGVNIQGAYSPEEMRHLNSLGYSSEMIQKMQNYDPSKDGSYLEFFQKTTQKPKEPNKNRLAGAQVLASLGDILTLMAQHGGSNKGAYVRDRQFDGGLRMSNEIKRIQDLYDQRLDAYNKGEYQAMLNDWQLKNAYMREERNNVRGAIAAKKKADAEEAQNAEKLAQQQAKLDAEAKKLDERKRHNEAVEDNQKKRTKIYSTFAGRGGRGGSTTKDKGENIIINPNPNNPSEQVVVNVPKGGIAAYATAGLADKEFMKLHPELVVQTVDPYTKRVTKTTPVANDKIANAYAKYLYEKQSAQPQTTTKTKTPPATKGKKKIAGW